MHFFKLFVYVSVIDPKNEMGNLFVIRDKSKWFNLIRYHNLGKTLVNLLLSLPEMQKFINSNQKFDLILCEILLDESMIGGFSYTFKAPVVAIQTSLPNIWANYLVRK